MQPGNSNDFQALSAQIESMLRDRFSQRFGPQFAPGVPASDEVFAFAAQVIAATQIGIGFWGGGDLVCHEGGATSMQLAATLNDGLWFVCKHTEPHEYSYQTGLKK
ncbi:MAG: hypothetical protein AB7J35_21120 [Dehalococcoidia bacterium]